MKNSTAVFEFIKSNQSATSSDIARALGLRERTVYRSLKKLIKAKQISKQGKPPGNVTYSVGAANNLSASKTKLTSAVASTTSVKQSTRYRKDDPPLFKFQVTNPITYLKAWWRRVMANEGMDLRFRIRPLTAIAMATIIGTLGFGVGRISFTRDKPFVKYVPVSDPAPTPTPNPWRETAFSGKLRFSDLNQKYYLLTEAAEAILLEPPETVSLQKFVGRRIFATGKYNQVTNTLQVTEAADLEILPSWVQTVPEVKPRPTPTPSVMPSPIGQTGNEYE